MEEKKCKSNKYYKADIEKLAIKCGITTIGKTRAQLCEEIARSSNIPKKINIQEEINIDKMTVPELKSLLNDKIKENVISKEDLPKPVNKLLKKELIEVLKRIEQKEPDIVHIDQPEILENILKKVQKCSLENNNCDEGYVCNLDDNKCVAESEIENLESIIINGKKIIGSKVTIDILKEKLNVQKCSVENNNCEEGYVCNLDDNKCVPDTETDLETLIINGKKVIGNKMLINTLKEKLEKEKINRIAEGVDAEEFKKAEEEVIECIKNEDQQLENLEDILEEIQEHQPEEILTGEFAKHQLDIMRCIGLV